MKKVSINALFIFCIIVLMVAFFVKGNSDPAYYQTTHETGVSGPFEGSNSTGRYALTEALVENNSLFLTEAQARFSSPDVVRYRDTFISIFMPGVSFAGAPFYMLGKQFGLQQVFAYLSVTLFAILNMLLITQITRKLGVNFYASVLTGFIFFFGTNALSYALSYTQHHASITFILSALLISMYPVRAWRNVLFGFCVGASVLFDVPNLLLLIPVGLYLLSKHIHLTNFGNRVKIAFNTVFFSFLLGLVPFITFLAWYNLGTTGSMTKIGQSIGRTDYFKEQLQEQQQEQHSTGTRALPISTRFQLTGMYTLMLSNERSWLFYSPVVLLGTLGVIHMYRRKRNQAIAGVITGTVLLNIVFYSLFEDAWGGWAFGPRYLIPAAALLCIALGVAIQTYSQRFWFTLLFGVTALYSVVINVLGAMTTSSIPPKIEATTVPYTYLYNIALMRENILSSLVYNQVFVSLPAWLYVVGVIGTLMIVIFALYEVALSVKEEKK